MLYLLNPGYHAHYGATGFEWSTKGWRGTVVAKALAEISPSLEISNPIGHLADEISRAFETMAEALANFPLNSKAP